MNELTIVHKDLNTRHLFKTSPIMLMFMANNRLLISEHVAKILKLKKGDKIIFGFDFKDKKCYCSKSNDPSAFVLNKPNGIQDSYQNALSFASKKLRANFAEVFNMPFTTLILTINPTPTGDWYELKQINNE